MTMRIALKHILTTPDILTYGNLLLGLLSMHASLSGNLSRAVALMLVCVVLDGLDGKVAGLLNRKTEFGRELDSLADAVSFGVSPLVFGYAAQAQRLGAVSPWLLGFMAFYLMCGVTRLARYNIMRDRKGFRGMPITVNGVLFPILFYAGLLSLLPVAYIVSGILMVSGMRVRRII